MGAAQGDPETRESVHLFGVPVRDPVVPGDLVVLTPSVVVAPLGAAELVASEQHRRALGDEQRGEEVTLLSRTQRAHRHIVGLALSAAVPRAVVVGAVPIVLAVSLVV